MTQEIIDTFTNLSDEYKKYVSDKMSVEDFREYNEILFSSHSCGIEGNSFFIFGLQNILLDFATQEPDLENILNLICGQERLSLAIMSYLSHEFQNS